VYPIFYKLAGCREFLNAMQPGIGDKDMTVICRNGNGAGSYKLTATGAISSPAADKYALWRKHGYSCVTGVGNEYIAG
jgi:hypothetical protein